MKLGDIGLVVFGYTLFWALIYGAIDIVLACRGLGTITQWVTSPGHELIQAAVICWLLVGVIGLAVHFLA